MSNELSTLDSKNILEWEDPEFLKSLKEIYAPTATNQEFKVFVNLGRATGLNPFLKELWLIKFGTAPAAIFIARDGYRRSAQTLPNYDYHLADAVYSNDNFSMNNGEVNHGYNLADRGKLLGAYCIVKRKSASRPIYVYADLKEYNLGKSVWATKPATMIKKVAEAQALRMAFQELFSGTHSEDEYEPLDNTKQGRATSASANINKLIEGKSYASLQDVDDIIDDAQTIDELVPAANLAKKLSPEDQTTARLNYAKKLYDLKQALPAEPEQFDEQTGEVLTELLDEQPD